MQALGRMVCWCIFFTRPYGDFLEGGQLVKLLPRWSGAHIIYYIGNRKMGLKKSAPECPFTWGDWGRLGNAQIDGALSIYFCIHEKNKNMLKGSL